MIHLPLFTAAQMSFGQNVALEGKESPWIQQYRARFPSLVKMEQSSHLASHLSFALWQIQSPKSGGRVERGRAAAALPANDDFHTPEVTRLICRQQLLSSSGSFRAVRCCCFGCVTPIGSDSTRGVIWRSRLVVARDTTPSLTYSYSPPHSTSPRVSWQHVCAIWISLPHSLTH